MERIRDEFVHCVEAAEGRVGVCEVDTDEGAQAGGAVEVEVDFLLDFGRTISVRVEERTKCS